VQGKGLASAACLLALCLAGCGGGGGGDSTGTSGEASQSGSTQAAPPALQKLRSSAKRIEEEREAPTKAPAEGAGKAKPAPSAPDPTPTDTHHDSGGGATQFRNKGGDNSIQESGREAGAPEREEAAAVLHAYLDARVAHQWPTACFYMAASLVATMEAFAAKYGKGKVQSCPQLLAALATGSSQRALEETAEANVGSLRTEGDRAFLLYHGPHEAPYAMPMAREGGAWKVGSLEGAPLQ
jgi:hypothetical protein